ncbi:hypothetical protein MO973_22910 [Paenibacillus sp. TRM 82003]|nr:hypothetical protein [Paenibacillus sp. TRM 82003]
MKRKWKTWLSAALSAAIVCSAWPVAPARAEAVIPPPVLEHISVGKYHTLAVDASGQAWAWGSNGIYDVVDEVPLPDNGAIGNGHLEYGGLYPNKVLYRNDFNELQPLSGIVEVGAGDGFSAALDKFGKVWTWGTNNVGQLGFSTEGSPVAVATGVMFNDLSNPFVEDIAVGESHVVALVRINDGTKYVYAWGKNDFAQLGDGIGSGYSPVPIQVKTGMNVPLTSVSSVHAGRSHSMAVTDDRRLYAWGDNRLGQVGSGTTDSKFVYAQEITSLANVQKVYSGWAAEHSYAVVGPSESVIDAVYGWGYNDSTGFLKEVNNGAERSPVSIGEITVLQPRDIAVGQGYTMIAAETGAVYGAGDNYYSPLTNDLVGTTHFKQLNGLSGVTDLVAGWASSFGRTPDGWLAWGFNDQAQLGTDFMGTNILTNPAPVREMIYETRDITIYLQNSDGEAVVDTYVELVDDNDYGWMSGMTDSDGMIDFSQVMPMFHDLIVDSQLQIIPVHWYENEEPIKVKVLQEWEPTKLKFVDESPETGGISGLLSWTHEYYGEAAIVYHAHFVDEFGQKLPDIEALGHIPDTINSSNEELTFAPRPIPPGATGIRIFVEDPEGYEFGGSDAWLLIQDIGAQGIKNAMYYDSDPVEGATTAVVEWDGMADEAHFTGYEVVINRYDEINKIGATIVLGTVEAAGLDRYTFELPLGWTDEDQYIGIRPTDGARYGTVTKIASYSDYRYGEPVSVGYNELPSVEAPTFQNRSGEGYLSGALRWTLPSAWSDFKGVIEGVQIYTVRDNGDGGWTKVRRLAHTDMNGYFLAHDGTHTADAYGVYLPHSYAGDGATHLGIYTVGFDTYGNFTENPEPAVTAIGTAPLAEIPREAIDTDGDATITLDEIVEYLNNNGFDADGDGTVDRDDIRYLLEQALRPISFDPEPIPV